MKKNILIMMLFLSMTIIAQENQNPPRVEDMHARKWEYMIEKSKLTTQDAAKVEPVFMEYEQAVWKLMEQNKVYYKKKHENKTSQSKPNFEEINERFINIETQKAQLLKNYYIKLKKVLPAETIFNYFKAERMFRQELIKDWQGKRNRGRD